MTRKICKQIAEIPEIYDVIYVCFALFSNSTRRI